MTSEKLRIILITGSGRSGSTILDNLLGQVPGFFSAGEVGNLWNYARPTDRLCSCGSRFRDCKLWRGVFKRILGEVDLDSAWSRLEADTYQRLRLKDLWQLTTAGGRRHFLHSTCEQRGRILDVYNAISAETGVRTIVDSSKSPGRAYLVTQIPELDVYVIHLVRDPRAVAFSWQRRKQDPSLPGTYMDVFGPVQSTLRWTLSQQVERLCKIPARYVLIRYEDFIARPEHEFERIFEMIGDGAEQRPRIVNRTISLAPVHSIDGNPSRFTREPLILKPDEEWRRKMSTVNRALVTALTWPLLRRYGYAFKGQSDGEGVEAEAL
jgi:hypothetical protein